MKSVYQFLFLFISLLMVACQNAPRPDYAEQPHIVQKRQELQQRLLKLLPEEQRSHASARQEATWLADTAYKASAAIARHNDPIFVNWLNNRVVNTRKNVRHRGLCWHYQHDLYRELRRRPLHYFTLGCCVKDQGRGGEHHVVYLAPKNGPRSKVILLDAWMWNGRLKVDDARKLNPSRWADLPNICRIQSIYYQEGHQWPMEHWSVLRGPDGEYEGYWLPEMRRSSQYCRMYNNIERGKKEHPGRLTNY